MFWKKGPAVAGPRSCGCPHEQGQGNSKRARRSWTRKAYSEKHQTVPASGHGSMQRRSRTLPGHQCGKLVLSIQRPQACISVAFVEKQWQVSVQSCQSLSLVLSSLVLWPGGPWQQGVRLEAPQNVVSFDGPQKNSRSSVGASSMLGTTGSHSCFYFIPAVHPGKTQDREMTGPRAAGMGGSRLQNWVYSDCRDQSSSSFFFFFAIFLLAECLLSASQHFCAHSLK